MRNIKYIIVHCSATAEGRDFHAKDIDRWHRHRGFNSIGYHYVVDLDGKIEAGRPESQVGAHVYGHNANSIGVVYVGGVAKDGKTPKDTRTAGQKDSLRRLLIELKRKYPSAIICGHRDMSPDKNHDGKIEPWEWMKACPSFDAKKEYQDIK
jgi:N-acetyl-anhydromuramyl-L-alanine amidase AmpD